MLDVLKGWTNAQKLAGYIGVNGISNQPIATHIGWSNIPFVYIYWLLLDYWIQMRNYDPWVAMDQIDRVQYVLL